MHRTAKKRKMKIGKKNKRIITVLSVILFILIVILCILGIKEMNNYETSVETGINGEDITAIKIKTGYCDLLYPEMWKDKLYIERVTSDEGETVQFWAAFEGKEKIQLFDIVFGGDDDGIGTLETKDGEHISVNRISYDIALDDSWTDSEKIEIHVMMFESEFLLMKLQETEGFQSK